MSTAQRAEPGTEIQLAGSVAIGTLPPEFQQSLEMRKLQNQVAAQLAGMNWGKSLDHQTRRAIADWGQQFRVDVTTEIHVLGGNVYLNAAFWMRHLAEMVAAGLVEYAYADHVEYDERLSRIGPDGEGEASRRLRERIKHGIPDKAASAVVFRIKLRSMEREVVGVKWCGNGTRKNDPVGDSMPVETSETRAARRAMRMLASHVPPEKADEIDAIEHTAEMLSDRVDHARKEIRASEARITALPPGRSAMPAMQAPLRDDGDPYSGIDESRVPVGGARPEPRRIEPTPRSPEARAAADAAAHGTDPYAPNADGHIMDSFHADASIDERAPLDAPAPRQPARGTAAFLMPFRQGASDKGTPIGDVATKDLADALRFAGDVPKYAAFVEHASEELERRRLDADDEEAEG